MTGQREIAALHNVPPDIAEAGWEVVTIEGLVVPSDWDEAGAVTGVAISCFDETDYRALKSAKAEELLGLLQSFVEVIGRVKKLEKGPGLIHILDYKKLEPQAVY